MKKIQLLLILFLTIEFTAQNITEINADLNLSDTLKFNREIRIYQSSGISNYTSIFRMFNYENKKWTSELYEHYSKVPGKSELKTEKENLKSKNDMEFIFLNFLRSEILNLPNQKEIKWKIKGRDSIFKVKRKWKGKEFVEYESSYKTKSILDGTSYVIQVRDYEKKNEFSYSNPETYLKEYYNVDELIYVSEILNIVRKEFKIWKIN
jgi:hypothetical protein